MTRNAQTRRKSILRRLIAADEARNDVLAYTGLTMPDYKHPGDVRHSRYHAAKHHKAIAKALHDIEARKTLRVIINCGPRHGKTELASRRFIAWHAGKHPDQSLIFGTYNETYANDNGRAVRDIMQQPEHSLVFPDFALRDGSVASQRLETTRGGLITFVGRGGSITGRGGHGIVIDDPIKDRQEADSRLIRDQLWTWFTQVISTRQMTTDSFILLIQTRWHEDDLVGRLTDPTNPYYDPAEAARWTVIDLPALALDNDPLGRKPGEALWPERFPKSFLENQQRMDPRGFQALYQGRPSTDQGAFFQAEHIQTYRPDQLPRNLRYYVASDHAVSTKQDRDKTALVPVGVDENDNIYIMPDVFWRHAASDQTVDAMIKLMAQYKPLYWWAERGAITKAIGPFLRKRMHEERTYCSIVELTPTVDKKTRAQSIQGRMAMGKVFFPQRANWWPDARDQLLKFPHGANDDFVDALAYIGLGLNEQVSASVMRRTSTEGKEGTFRWWLNRARSGQQNKAKTGGW